jgi:hypothetical protein
MSRARYYVLQLRHEVSPQSPTHPRKCRNGSWLLKPPVSFLPWLSLAPRALRSRDYVAIEPGTGRKGRPGKPTRARAQQQSRRHLGGSAPSEGRAGETASRASLRRQVWRGRDLGGRELCSPRGWCQCWPTSRIALSEGPRSREACGRSEALHDPALLAKPVQRPPPFGCGTQSGRRSRSSSPGWPTPQ